MDEVLPWDHLDCGVSREFLLAERARAFQGLETPDCRRAGCQDCGVCDHDRIDLWLESPPAVEPPPPADAAPAPAPVRYRLTYAKLDQARWLGHLELVSALYRSLRRSGLPLVFTAGFHPLPRVSFHGALPVGVESLAETLDVELAANLEPALLVQTLNRVLPAGLKILAAAGLPKRLAPPRLEMAVYQAVSPEPVFFSQAAEAFLSRAEFLVTRRRRQEDRIVDLRQLVAKLTVADASHLELHLRLKERDNLKAAEALRHIFDLNDDQSRDLQILKLRSF